MRKIIDFDAMQKWNNTPEEFQQKILNNVFCGKCRGSTTIIDYEITNSVHDILLEGKCKKCGNKVARLLESG